MKERNRLKNRRLLEMLDYLDEEYIAEVVDNLKLPNEEHKPLPRRVVVLRAVKTVAALVACALLLGALIPVISYVTANFPDFVAYLRGESTTEVEVTETDSPPPETTEPVKHEHNGSEGLIYKVNADGASVALISYGTFEGKDVIVASLYDGMPVTVIGNGAFEGSTYKTITVPEGVISVGIGAFKNCAEVEVISLPGSVTDIGANAFEGCISLRSIGIPSGITVITTGMFTDCKNLTHVRMQKTVKRIIMGAFIGCEKLESIEFVGKKAEWNSVQKGEYWNINSAIKQVDCNDGSITIQIPPTDLPTDNGSEGLEYRLSGVEATLASIGSCTDKNVVIASTYKGYPVKWIAANALEGARGMESIVIPETVATISSRSFADCTNLKSITLGAAVRWISDDSFAGCGSLEEIKIDSDNTFYYVSENCLIEKTAGKLVLAANNAKIPDDGSIAIIGSNAFPGLTNITEIVIPEGVHTVMADAINGCPNLQKLSLPSTVNNVGKSFIANCDALSVILFPNGHETYSAEGNCIIDKSTKTLLRGFAGSTIPDWVTTIGESAFEGCTELTEINFPSSLKVIGESAFKNCTSLKKIKIEGAVTLKNYAFFGCTSLSEVELDDRVTFDYSHIFSYCTSLEYIRVPKSVTRLNCQWEGCTSLKTVVMHDDITFLAGALFYGCTSLESFYIGPNVHELRQNFLVECQNLKEIVYGGTRHEWYTIEKHSSWRSGAGHLEVIRCTDGDITDLYSTPMVGSYGLLYRENADGKSATFIGFKEGVLDSFEIASTYNGLPVTGVADGVLSKINSSGKITLGTNIVTVGSELFAFSPYVSHIELRPNTKSIEKDAFRGCIGLKDLSFMGTKAAWEKIDKHDRWNYGTMIEVVHCLDGDMSVTPHPQTNDGSAGLAYRINQDANGEFYAVFTGLGTCTDADIVIASDYYGYPVIRLTNSIGSDNTTVRSVTLPDSITAIPDNFFRRCHALEKVTIPDSVTTIGRYAFADCAVLKDIRLPKSLEVIDQNAFSGCASLEKIELPESLIEIGNYAFNGCALLSKIKIPESVTFLGYSSFGGTQIESIHIPKNVTEMSSYLGASIKKITVDPENPVYVLTGNCLIDRERKTLLKVFGVPEFPTDGSIRYIDENAFYDIAAEIKKLILPEGLEEIGWYYASGLESLEELHIPSTFVNWSPALFEECVNLKKITVAEGNPRYYSVDNCIIERETGELIMGCNTSVIPTDGSVKSIGMYAFYGCKSLESITIPEGVTEIGYHAFFSCTSLREVKLPESLVMINDAAFAYCIALSEITLPENLKSHCLALWLFEGCSSLETIYIPRTIKYIDGFYGCTSLREVVYGGTVEEWNSITVYGYAFRGTALEKIRCTDGVITEIPYQTEMPVVE